MTTEENTKIAKQVERAVIDDKQKGKLAAMTDQANAILQGIATVTKSDIVNLILANHGETLNDAELEELKSSHLDQVKYAFWLAKRLKEAKALGQDLSLQDLLAQSHPVISQPPQKAPRRPRKKKEGLESAAEEPNEAKAK